MFPKKLQIGKEKKKKRKKGQQREQEDTLVKKTDNIVIKICVKLLE